MCEESISQKTILLSKAYLKVLDDPTYTTKSVLFSIRAYKRKLWLSTYPTRVIIWSVYLPLVSEDLNLYKISFSNNFSVKNLHGFLISLATINYNLFWVHSLALSTVAFFLFKCFPLSWLYSCFASLYMSHSSTTFYVFHSDRHLLLYSFNVFMSFLFLNAKSKYFISFFCLLYSRVLPSLNADKVYN